MENVQVKTANYQSLHTTVNTWLNSEHVCLILKISVRTLVTYRQRGILPFSQIGRKIYYKASDIEEYLERHYIKANYQKVGEYGN
jgi:hypothetical protein